MKTVILSGPLGETFGRDWQLDVRTPAEALRAIDANRPGFFKALLESGDAGVGYRVLLDDRELEAGELQAPFGRETFTVVPVIGGAGDGTLKTVLGVVLVAASIYFSGGSMSAVTPVMGISYGSIAMFGVALTLSGVSQMLAPSTQGIQQGSDNKASYYFNGPVNVQGQGGPVPVGFGRMIVGSTTINGGIQVDEIPV